jgi:hypothetical protein
VNFLNLDALLRTFGSMFIYGDALNKLSVKNDAEIKWRDTLGRKRYISFHDGFTLRTNF